MVVFYGFIFGFFVLVGIMNLQDAPTASIHNFLIALYFFVMLYAFKGKAFSAKVHIGLAIALLANAGLQYYVGDVWGVFISLIFAFFTYNDRNRFRREEHPPANKSDK